MPRWYSGRAASTLAAMTRPHAVMFDLDGTLADTLHDLTEATNRLRGEHDLSPLPAERYRYLVGQGAPWLVQHALELPDDDAQIAPAVERFKHHLAQQNDAHTTLYPGIAGMLDALAQRQMPLAVLSNKPDELTVDMVQRLLRRWSFAQIRGHRQGSAPKPDPAAALAVCDELGVEASRWLYVGDTRVDMLTGNAAGMCAVGVTWGFREEKELRESGAHHIIHQPTQLLDLL